MSSRFGLVPTSDDLRFAEEDTVVNVYDSRETVHCRSLSDLTIIRRELTPARQLQQPPGCGLCFMVRMTSDLAVGTFYRRPWTHQLVGIRGLMLGRVFSTGHSSYVFDTVRVSDTVIASGSMDGFLREVDISDGTPLAAYAYPSWVNCLTLPRDDSSQICGGGGDAFCPLRIWDRATSNSLLDLDSGFQSRVVHCDSNPDAGTICCGSVLSEIALHDARTSSRPIECWKETDLFPEIRLQSEGMESFGIRNVLCVENTRYLLLKLLNGTIAVHDERNITSLVNSFPTNGTGFGTITPISVSVSDNTQNHLEFLSSSTLELIGYDETRERTKENRVGLSHWRLDGKILQKVEDLEVFGVASLGDAEVKGRLFWENERLKFLSGCAEEEREGLRFGWSVEVVEYEVLVLWGWKWMSIETD